MFVFCILNGCFDNNANIIVNKKPVSTQYKNALLIFVSKITFFIKIASVPKNKSAIIL